MQFSAWKKPDNPGKVPEGMKGKPDTVKQT